MTPAARAVAAAVTAPDEAWPVGRRPGYFVILCPEGEAPYIEMAKSVDALCKKVKAVDGLDVYAFACFGIPIPITRGSPRMLMLPNDTVAVLERVVRHLPELDVVVDLQDDNFLGPPELAFTSSVPSGEADEDATIKRKRGRIPPPPDTPEDVADEPQDEFDDDAAPF